MKLINLIVRHVPREKIHPDANFFAQDNYRSNQRLSQFKKMPVADGAGDWNDFSYITGSRIVLPELAEDARTTVITRDELMQAYDAAEVHFDTVAQREQLMCIFLANKSDHTEIWLPPGSQVTVEDNWLTVRCHGNLMGMFRMENVEAWLINEMTK